MAEEKKVRIKKIQSSAQLKTVMADYFHELSESSKTGSPKIAWCSSVGPAELLLSMGFLVHYPENHGAVLGSTRTANDYIPVANAAGFSPDICSYLTSDIGAFIKKETPLSRAYEWFEGVPKPSVLVYNTNQCRDVQDWFGWYSRELGVPSIGVSTYRSVGELKDYHLEGIVGQIKDLIPTLEQVSGKKFDIDKFRSVVACSRDCAVLWRKVLETNAAMPAPMTFFDATIHMGPAVVLRGSPKAVEYYEVLLKELEEKVARKDGAVDGEKFRLYWEGMPIWGKLRNLAEFFIELKTAVVASTYCNSWIFDAFDPAEPFVSMARVYSEIFIARDEKFKEAYIEDMVNKYKLDGILFHDSKTCPNNSNNRYGMPERLQKKLNIPTVTINGDLNDLRCYSEEQAKTNIEAFIEQLEGE